MALATATRLGPYEILGLVGSGGMGEVYRARDTRLDRIVAIKVSNERFSARFEREARAIAALNHPHICALYDVGPNYLVMEYIEGETLAMRLKRGRLSLDQALRYAIQIAAAMDKAHRRGVVHRDLKPANIMLSASSAKILDFGLAKMAANPVDSAAGADCLVETRTTPLTGSGVIVGTLQYMAPEQLEGKDADPRSDIFAFGAVLFEMATGRKAFEGESQASLIAAILRTNPPLVSQLEPGASPVFDRAVQKCLAKDADQRWQTAADLADELEWIAGGAATTVPASTGALSALGRLAAAAVLLLVAVLGWTLYAVGSRATSGPLYQLSIVPPPHKSASTESNSLALSPDGRLLTFVVVSDGASQLYVRWLDSPEARAVPGTAGAVNAYPFWSPDSQQIGYFADGKLKRVRVSGIPPPQVICDAPQGRGGSWNRDDVILFCPRIGAVLHRVAASGGQPVAVTALDAARREDAHYWPQFLPDGKHFLYFARSAVVDESAIVAGSLDGRSQPVRLVNSKTAGFYSPPGYLLRLTEGTLVAQRFDERRLVLSGDPAPVAAAAGSASFIGLSLVTASESGVLAYRVFEAQERRLTWIGRQGQALGSIASPGAYRSFRLSPDQKRLAVEIVEPKKGSTGIWVIDLERGVTSRFVSGLRADRSPVWSPAGDWIAFFSDRIAPANLYRKATGGAGSDERLTEKNRIQFTDDWSSNGKLLLFEEQDPVSRSDLWVLPLSAGAKASPAVQTSANEVQGQFSPDGRFIAYVSDETGRNEVYVQTFPTSARRWHVSTAGGSQPRWSGDGHELFYVAPGEALMAVLVKPSGSEFQMGAPRPLFEHPALRGEFPYYAYDVSSDGQRFLVGTPVGGGDANPIQVVINWTAALKK